MVLITGASGNVGQEILRQMLETGRSVRAAYQSKEKAANAPKGAEAVILDYNQPETMQAALRDVDRVFLVGPVSPTLVELERNATDAIKRAGVRQVVKCSAMGPRDATFPGQHRESEDYIQASGVGFTFLRPNGFMQNVVAYFGATIKSQNAFYGCQGDGKVSHIDLRDIGAVAVKTLTEDGHLGKIYTLTGPEAVTNARIAEILSTVLGRQIKYVDLPPAEMKKAEMAAGLPEWGADGVVNLYQMYSRGGASEVTDDVERVAGRKPISLEQFVKDHKSSF